jgi:hypothetical protein
MMGTKDLTSDFVINYIQDGYQQEVERAEALDSKSNSVITIASFLTGFSFALITLAYKDLANYFLNSGMTKPLTGVLLVISNACFLGSVIFSILSSSVRSYWAKLIYSSDDLDQWLKGEDITETKLIIAKQVQQQWLHNRTENDAKARKLRISLLLIGVGASVLSITVMFTLGYLLIWSNS